MMVYMHDYVAMEFHLRSMIQETRWKHQFIIEKTTTTKTSSFVCWKHITRMSLCDIISLQNSLLKKCNAHRPCVDK